MIRVVYSSVAVRPFSPEGLLQLLTHSRARNRERDLTGLLLYRNGRFLQALEGPAEQVDALIEKIWVDRRHAGLRILMREEIAEREFPDWSMGFEDLDEATEETVPGLSRFLERDFDSSYYVEHPSSLWLLLSLFKVGT